MEQFRKLIQEALEKSFIDGTSNVDMATALILEGITATSNKEYIASMKEERDRLLASLNRAIKHDTLNINKTSLQELFRKIK